MDLTRDSELLGKSVHPGVALVAREFAGDVLGTVEVARAEVIA